MTPEAASSYGMRLDSSGSPPFLRCLIEDVAFVFFPRKLENSFFPLGNITTSSLLEAPVQRLRRFFSLPFFAGPPFLHYSNKKSGFSG